MDDRNADSLPRIGVFYFGRGGGRVRGIALLIREDYK